MQQSTTDQTPQLQPQDPEVQEALQGVCEIWEALTQQYEQQGMDPDRAVRAAAADLGIILD